MLFGYFDEGDVFEAMIHVFVPCKEKFRFLEGSQKLFQEVPVFTVEGKII